MHLLALGGRGFIGRHLVSALLASGHRVSVFDNGRLDRAPFPGVDHRIGDLSDMPALLAALEGCDAVLHLISTTSPASAEADPVADVTANLNGSLRLLQAMHSQGVRRLLFLSSGGMVYGAADILPTPETHPLRPIGSYGIVKAAVERHIAVAAQWGLTAAVIRPSNVYGPGQTLSASPGFVSSALMHLARNQPVPIFGDGSVVRDFLHVGDLVDLCLSALGSGESLTLNAGTGRGRTLLDVVDTIRRVTGLTPQIEFRAGRPIDVPVSILDCGLAKGRFDWTPRHAFEDGLAETWDWVRAQA